MDKAKRDLAMRSFIAASMAAFALLLFAVVIVTVDVLWLLVLSVLLAVVLRIPVDWLRERLRMKEGWAFGIVLLTVMALAGGGLWIMAPQVVDQGRELLETIPRSPRAFRGFLGQYEWGRTLSNSVPDLYDRLIAGLMAVAGDWNIWMSPLRILGGLIFVSFVSVYLAAAPRTYVEGLIRMLPVDQRRQGRVVLEKLGVTLKWWMVGRLVSMLSVGSLTAVMLWYLGIPLALVLGILTTLLTFVPYLGPLAASFPILIVTLIEAPGYVLLVLVLYTAIQLLEGYLLTPLIQRITVYLPPAMTLIAEVVMGLLFGTLGVVVATPVAAIFLVLINGLYVNAWLEGRKIEDSVSSTV
jgi:predicted PurR-regulated permease PerM